ncbi:MAG: acetate kinase [Actinomycetaceae bacterium]|nr:acetate kinase [Actinomycetaceae bacterium]
MTSTVFVINSGSSSVKYQLINPETGESLASGLAERIGETNGHLRHKAAGEVVDLEMPLPDHSVALREVKKLFDTTGPRLEDAGIVAVGHRIVQGGKHFSGPALITQAVYDKIVELVPLGPLHNPAHLLGIDVAKEIFPDLPHVAVFDTAFFQTLPNEAATYALKRDVAEKYEIRRYGAHGTSHQFVSGLACDYLQREDLKQVTLHLGNGASASAVAGRQAIDTSMGLTPLEGLVMGTRTGDIDPAAVFHLQRVAGMTFEEVDTLFNKQSGMKGLCGDNDMREVWARVDRGEADAIEATEVYVHRLLRYVGAYTAELGGLDALVFTAGIGENDNRTRAALCKRLEFMGLKLDEAANNERGDGLRVISTPDSTVTVMIIPTNEEWAIAQQAMTLV